MIIYASESDLLGSGTPFFFRWCILLCHLAFELSGLVRAAAGLRGSQVCCSVGPECEGQEPAVPSLCPCAERESGPELPFKFLSSPFHFTVIALLLCNLLFLLLPIVGFGQPAYGTAPTDFVWLYLSFMYLL